MQNIDDGYKAYNNKLQKLFKDSKAILGIFTYGEVCQVCSRMQKYSYCMQKVDNIFLNLGKYTKFGENLLKDEKDNIKI